MLACVSLDSRVQLLQVVNVLAEDFDILHAVLCTGSASEGKHCRAPLQPPHMHLRTHQAPQNDYVS